MLAVGDCGGGGGEEGSGVKGPPGVTHIGRPLGGGGPQKSTHLMFVICLVQRDCFKNLHLSGISFIRFFIFRFHDETHKHFRV